MFVYFCFLILFLCFCFFFFFFFSSRRRHTRCGRDWSSDVCSSDLFGGNYDLHFTWLPNTDAQFAAYDAAYAATTKRCALWSIDPATRTFAPLTDVPGTGDTCYPSIIPQSHHRFLVYNYTSPLDGTDQ